MKKIKSGMLALTVALAALMPLQEATPGIPVAAAIGIGAAAIPATGVVTTTVTTETTTADTGTAARPWRVWRSARSSARRW